MTRAEKIFHGCALLLLARLQSSAQLPASMPKIPWAGPSCHRLLVRVDPYPLSARNLDRMPARVTLPEPLDPASIEILRYGWSTGAPLPGKIDFRLDDGPVPLFMSHYWPANGREGGKLIWRHEQNSAQPSLYAIYYDPWKPGAGVAPRAWIGDGDIEYVPRAPFPHVLLARPFGYDWDGDGKTDVIVGDELGYVTLYRNLGTVSDSHFGIGEPLLADGKPVKVEWSAAPFVADWNGDGLPDLLVAQEPQGVIRYYQNIGTRAHPQLTDRGLIAADGAVLKPPYLPVPEMPPGIFGDKYGSIAEAVDWKGDGRLDLLVGTYITGEIYLYRNIGSNADGTPRLHFEGPLKADGKDLDVIWNSTPSAADLNDDGRPELISGGFAVSSSGGDRPQDSRLHYYVRSGSFLHEMPFPFDESESSALQKLVASGGAPFSTAVTDLNGDGLIDLLVGTATGTVVYFENVGSRTAPRFRFIGPLEGSWVPNRLNFDSIVDFYGNGEPVLLEGGFGTKTVLDTGAPSFLKHTELKTISGKPMGRAAAHGDDFGDAQCYDFDHDGKPDLVFGTVDGGLILYRNVGTRSQPQFQDGEPMTMAGGEALIAGFAPQTKVTDFTVLQGNRAIPAVGDFNGDGKTDLIVGNALGEVLYFENIVDNQHPRFGPPRKLLELPGRVFLTTTDWDGDGLLDLIVASSGGTAGKQLFLLRHVDDRHRTDFEPPVPLPTPVGIPYPVPTSFDWDGDGDQDLLIASSYGFVYLLDGSFLRHGYAQGRIIGSEDRPGASCQSAGKRER